jgi:putative hydrolase of the HAD superfamily
MAPALGRDPMTAVTAVLFDWGGTLAVHAAAELEDLWRAAASVLAPDDVEGMVGALVGIEAASWQRTTTTMRSARLMDLLREASDELDLDVADAVLTTAHDAHLDAWTPTIRHVPEAADVLADVRSRGLAVGLLSNTHWPRTFHEQFLDRDGLADLIDQRLYTSEIDWIKPHPQPFAMLADRLGVMPDGCVFVGDRPIDDIQGASAAGMRTVWIANDHAPGDPSAADARVDSLAELPAILTAWGA